MNDDNSDDTDGVEEGCTWAVAGAVTGVAAVAVAADGWVAVKGTVI